MDYLGLKSGYISKMLNQPRNFKYKKLKKKFLKNFIENRSFTLKKGKIGLKTLTNFRITARQIEAIRQVISRTLRRKGKIWINLFPFLPATSKPIGARMGKGKGSVVFWYMPIDVGTVLFEITGISFYKARLALLKGAKKLPIKTKLIFR
jgi:large subunit ribosomal protein L16